MERSAVTEKAAPIIECLVEQGERLVGGRRSGGSARRRERVEKANRCKQRIATTSKLMLLNTGCNLLDATTKNNIYACAVKLVLS